MDTNLKEKKRSSWHSAFFEALLMELAEYRDALEFFPEHPLTDEPLQIDCVIVKKAKDVIIEKNIAAIFREFNIIEYKSPADYVSVGDFYKVHSYTFLYASLNKIPIKNMTITFVENRHPRKLIKTLREELNLTVVEKEPGIYTVEGGMLPVQIIDSSRLSAEENLWLKSLDNALGLEEAVRVTEEVARLGKGVRIGAYLDVITRANSKRMEEALDMGKTKSFEQILEDKGWGAKWEAKGEIRGRAEGRAEGHAEGRAEAMTDAARKLKGRGMHATDIADTTGLSAEEIERL